MWDDISSSNNSISYEGFDAYLGFKVPDTKYSWVTKINYPSECDSKCLSHCSCMAYSYQFSGSNYSNEISPNIHNETRADGSRRKVNVKESSHNYSYHRWIISWWIYFDWLLQRTHIFERNESQDDDLELPWFDLHTISIATNNFSENNKLGEGGFGPVYKGTLEGGQEIAVKRLLMCSGQGVNEFKNGINGIWMVLIVCGKILVIIWKDRVVGFRKEKRQLYLWENLSREC
ncbi:hypothetical protein CsatB_028761 [Cannabis sativa]